MLGIDEGVQVLHVRVVIIIEICAATARAAVVVHDELEIFEVDLIVAVEVAMAARY